MKKTIFTIVVLGFLSFSFTNLFAQSNCASALPLTPGTQQCGNNSYVGDFPDDNSAPNNPCYDYYNDGEYWFSWVGTGYELQLDVSGLTETYSGIYVLDDCPSGSPTCIASHSNSSSTANYSITTPALTAGHTYYIVIANWGSPYSTDFCLDATDLTPAVLMANGSVTTCSGVFMDPEGTGGYNDFNGSMTMTFNSGSTAQLQFVFTTFDTRENNDNLKIYDGPTTASPLIGTYANSTSPGTILSSGTSLTFVWTTDNNGDGDPGWEANISCVSNMSYVSTIVTQLNTATVVPNDIEQEIACIQIVMDGTLNPLDVTNFNLRTDGTTNPTTDIQNAKMWYTGNSSVFATTTQFGSTVASPNGFFAIAGNQTLQAGTNYFWLTYDIKPGALGNDLIDACYISALVDGSSKAPPSNCVSGSRTIIVPPANDNPCDAELLSVSSGICNYTTRHNYDATNSSVPDPGCSWYGGQDVWFKVVVPASGRLIADMDVASGPTDFDMAWYTGPDCNNLTELECDDYQSQNGSMPMICRTGMLCTVPGDCGQEATLTPGDTVWIRVWEYGGGSTGLFDICVYEPDPPGPPSNCSSPTNIASLPYTGNGLTTCCKQNDYDASDGCVNSYMDGEDYMFTYTPSVNQLINITISGTSDYTGVFVTDKCPDAGGVNCIAQNTNWSGNPFLCDVSVDAGTTYYIMVDTDPGPTCTNFNIQVAEAFAPTCNLNYTVSSIPYVGYSVAGTAISLPIDDRFSDYIPIGFPFCYDGIQYTQLLVSSNGYVIFDPVGCATNLPSANAAPNSYTGWSITAAVPNTSNAPRNAIMFPWQDLDPSISGNLRYRLYGTAPNRYFVLSVNQLAYFSSSCSSSEFTGQLVLRETTNNIEIHMLRKDMCNAWNDGRAILGLHNYNGTIAVAPYNYPAQWTANSEGWQFTCNCPGCIVLPIELMSFNGENLDISSNKLHWKTASELNNEYFEIERKDQYADEFVKIGEHDGAGFSNIIQEYEFVDDEVKTEVSYYRLKQVDYNGEYSYSKTISIGNTPEAENRIYPNPANDVLNLSFNVMAESITVYIVNTIGEVVYQETYDADNSIQSKIDISKFAAGTYQVLVRDDKSNVLMQEQLIIQR